MQLKGKVALVTGAGSGIGKAIAIRFAREGANVVVNTHPGGRHTGPGVLAGISEHNPDALIVPANVSNRIEVETLISETIQRFGRLDIAVNNAGIQTQKPFLEVTDEEWNKVISVNLYGSFLVSQMAARQMVKQGQGGKLIFISSVHEDIPFVGYTAYCASKGGIRMLMRNLAMELAQHRINVNNIAPGAIATPINEDVLEDPTEKKNAVGEIPWGRFGRPEEVASVALFLASADSEYVTGSTYYVDGGLTQQVTKF
jgi:glucose 1-dehydrogenase